MDKNETKNSQKRLILVLGMHRSGTSAITQGLDVMGVSLGGDLLADMRLRHPGYFEDGATNRLNEDILHALGGHWYSVKPLEFKQLPKEQREAWIEKGVELLLPRFANQSCVGMKDPRMNRLLPFWQEVATQMGIELSFVIAVRNPAEVMSSLTAHENLPASISYILWVRHMVPAVLLTEGASAVVVSYEALMQAPIEQLQRVAKKLELMAGWDDKKQEQFQRELLENAFHYHPTELDSFWQDTAANGLIKDLFAELQRAAKGDSSVHSDALKDAAVKCQGWLDRSREILSLVDAQYQHIRHTPAAIAEASELRKKVSELQDENELLKAKLLIAEDDKYQLQHSAGQIITAPIKVVGKWLKGT